MSVRLYVGNLPKEEIEKQTLQDFFVDAGEGASTKVIKDRKTGKCRGFAFVTVPTDEEADSFIEKYDGQSFMDSPLKIEKALPRAKGAKEDGSEDAPAVSTAPAPISKAKRAASSGGGDRERSGNSGKRSGGGKKQGGGTSYSSGSSDSVQPDPRWASELAKLKAMLETTNV